MELKLIAQRDKGLDIAAAADNMNDDIQLKFARSILQGIRWWRRRGLLLVLNRDQS